MDAIVKTEYDFPEMTGVYKGKVRDVYTIRDELLVMVTTDRISAFDVVLPVGIPYKGAVLNMIAARALDATEDIVPNWKIDTPDPMVTIGKDAEPFKVEMVIRAYLSGHAWRLYKNGKRRICGVPMPEGMKENDRFPEPLITPTTKAMVGHDEDISREEILRQGLVAEKDYNLLEEYTRKLFARGTEMAAERGLILVDTKYEFGKLDGQVILIDEVHTPDSSRYFYLEGYHDRQDKGEAQKQLSKEFVREWLMAHGFRGQEGEQVPVIPSAFVKSVSERYIELFEGITGEVFNRFDITDARLRVEDAINRFLKAYYR